MGRIYSLELSQEEFSYLSWLVLKDKTRAAMPGVARDYAKKALVERVEAKIVEARDNPMGAK